MKIISWNVNGIRAWYKKGCLDWVLSQSPDFFCFQETKAEVDQLPIELIHVPGYNSFFESSKTRKGYSGVAVYTKYAPVHVEYGLGVPELDQEGRFMALFFQKYVVINCYFPNGGGEPHRLEYKLSYYKAFHEYVTKLEKRGLDVIFCGDVNVAHTEIDIARPKENENHVGFLPVERRWFTELIRDGYIDTFRHLFPDKKDIYTWWDVKTRSRDRNIGWRIDYVVVSQNLTDKIMDAKIHDTILGSDHCPIESTINIKI